MHCCVVLPEYEAFSLWGGMRKGERERRGKGNPNRNWELGGERDGYRNNHLVFPEPNASPVCLSLSLSKNRRANESWTWIRKTPLILYLYLSIILLFYPYKYLFVCFIPNHCFILLSLSSTSPSYHIIPLRLCPLSSFSDSRFGLKGATYMGFSELRTSGAINPF